MLISPAEATEIIAGAVPSLPTEDCPLAAAHGRVLRQAITADRPLPPFDRITMDGFAVSAAAVAQAGRSLRVAGFQAAGMRALELPSGAAAVEVATGAVLPRGADAVVPYEETERTGETVKLGPDADVTTGHNIHRAGSDFAAGVELVSPGHRLTGREIAVAASVGCARLSVAARPSIAVVATGDELVEVDSPRLSPQQIRKSNDYAIRATLLQSGLAGRVERRHLRDLRHEVEAGLRAVLAEFDVVVLSGGVSKGKLDLIPSTLADLGVKPRLHGVAQRPGKPMWFGASSRQQPVFSLPGNPVSSFTCLHRYVLPALRHMAGLAAAPPEVVALAESFHFPKPMTFFLPVTLAPNADGQTRAHPAPFNTSGDFASLVGTTGFVELPAHESDFPTGYCARLWRWIE